MYKLHTLKVRQKCKAPNNKVYVPKTTPPGQSLCLTIYYVNKPAVACNYFLIEGCKLKCQHYQKKYMITHAILPEMEVNYMYTWKSGRYTLHNTLYSRP